MKYTNHLFAVIFSLVSSTSFGQNVLYPCGTDENAKQLEAKHPEIAEQKAKFTAAYKEAMKDYNANDFKKKQQAFGKTSQPKYIIPVVVHIFHNNSIENISDAQVQSEIDFLNKSFRKLNSDTGKIRAIFKDIAADAQIEFRLAKKDPKGACTDGIVRYYTPFTLGANDETKPLSVWDTKRYLNIWVVNTIARGGGVGVAGYAQFPFATPGGTVTSNTDGIMVIHNEFGNVGTSIPGQTPNVTTSTHEIGHWLGLFHPFQGDSCDNDNDGVVETPNTYFIASRTEPLRNRCAIPNYNTCSSDNPDLPDMQENFMDYFIGPCASNMFTLEQVARMHFCLENYRRDLWQPDNLERTGVAAGFSCSPLPIASFNTNSNTNTICVDAPVGFTNNTYNAPATSFTWNFGEGANPATSTSESPINIRWTTGGWKTISLTATGPNGTSTNTQERYIYVQEPGEYKAVQGVHFADWDYQNNFLQEGWTFQNDAPAQWKPTTIAQTNGNRSLVLERDQMNFGYSYSLVSPTFNLSGASNPYFAFDYSFATTFVGASTNDSRDALRVFVSFDCGKNWIRRSIAALPEPSNDPAVRNTINSAGDITRTNQYFIPTKPSQWKSILISGNQVGAGTQLASVRFKIQFEYAGGNNLYFDNLRLGVTNSVNELTAKDVNFNVYPNPFNTSATISYELFSASSVSIKVFDLLGKEVGELSNGKKSEGLHEVELNKTNLGLSAGIYFIKTNINGSEFSSKVIIH